MATSVVFGNKICKLPGSYARVVSGVPQTQQLASYNNFLLIDMGAGKGFTSAQGIGGHGKECIYSLDQEMANYYIKGGILDPVLEGLFQPAGKNKPGLGIGTLYYIKAATTTPASIENPSFFGGKLLATSVKTVEEGVICNSYPSNITSYTNLKKGFALRCVYNAEVGKGYIEIYQGSFQGTNLKGYLIGTTEEEAEATLVYRSRKCKNLTELITFLNKNQDFKALIKAEGLIIANSEPEVNPEENNGEEVVASNSVRANEIDDSFGEINIDETFIFTGATETYMNTHSELNEVLDYTLNLDYSCMMVAEDNNGTAYLSDLLDHVKNDAKGFKHVISYKADKDDAILLAQDSDCDLLLVTNGEVKKTSKSSATGFITHDAIVTAAYVAGRIFGLSPEIAGTMKSLGIDGMEVEPSDKDLEDFLDAGVITPYYDSDLSNFVLSQCVNTLQANTQLINEDCSTFSVQAKRILAQVIKNLVLQSKIDFWGGEQGVNKATLSDAYVKAWTSILLGKLTVASNKTENNYLMSYEVTKVETIEDTKRVYISVTINGEITKVFFLVTVLG